MSQAVIEPIPPSLSPILQGLQYTPPSREAGSYPGWQFVFCLHERSAFSPTDIYVRGKEIAAFDEMKVQGDWITIKFIGTKNLDKPEEVKRFHQFLLRLTTERAWEPY